MPRPGRKQAVLDAAVALFSRKGYHATTVRDIADACGMLSGSLYAHISSKEELLFAIVVQASEQFTEALAPIVAGKGSAAQKLRWSMAAHLRIMASSREAATVFMHEWRALSEPHRTVAAQRRDEYEALLTRIIAEGIASGEFRNMDLKFARLLVLSSVNWIYQWYDPAGPLGPDEVADQFADLLLQGFLT